LAIALIVRTLGARHCFLHEDILPQTQQKQKNRSQGFWVKNADEKRLWIMGSGFWITNMDKHVLSRAFEGWGLHSTSFFFFFSQVGNKFLA